MVTIARVQTVRQHGNTNIRTVFLRFQGQKPNLGTASKLGIFQLAFELRENNALPQYAYDELQKNLSWLKMHLKSPEILNDDEHYRAIAWFKPEAHEPLKRIWAIKAVLEDYGYQIDMIKTREPGHVIYEDGWQVVAKPQRNSA